MAPSAISTIATVLLRCSRMNPRFDSMYARKNPEPVQRPARESGGRIYALPPLEDLERHLLDQLVFPAKW